MSKAFTRESDDAPERTIRPLPSPLPPGVKNYITPAGAKRLREELDQLVQIERPQVAASSEAKEKLPLIDQRIAYLHRSLQSCVIVNPPDAPEEQVKFGATVLVRTRGGQEERYRIVGVNETDVDQGWVSWRSPLAKALLNARCGQRVKFRIPSGEEELEIVNIMYE